MLSYWWTRNKKILNEPSSNNLQEQNIQAELDYVKLQSENAGAIQEEAQELRYKKFYKFCFELRQSNEKNLFNFEILGKD